MINIGCVLIRLLFQSRRALLLENIAMRQQLAVLQRNKPRPRLKRRDRLFWAVLSRVWSGWRGCLTIVQPATVISWQRSGFRLFWRWKSRKKSGRPTVPQELKELIRQMSMANRLWGVPRIQSELAKLGIKVARSTIARYMVKHPKRSPASGRSWKTFIHSHIDQIVAVDFLTVPTASFRVLYVFVVLSLKRREILHIGFTPNPTATWTANQLTDAFPWDEAPRFLQRDRDGIFGKAFINKVKAMGIEEIISAPRSPWQNGYVERVIGTIKRECIDHHIVFGESHLRAVLKEYVEYYNISRTHLSLNGDCPEPRGIESTGRVNSIPWLGGLHHTYRRKAG